MTWSIEMFWCMPVGWPCDVMWTLYHIRDAAVALFVEAIFGLATEELPVDCRQKACSTVLSAVF